MGSDWSVKVTKADNGFVLEWEEEYDEGDNTFTKRIVCEEETNLLSPEEDLVSVKKMLDTVLDRFGINYSKHNKKNIVVEIRENKDEN